MQFRKRQRGHIGMDITPLIDVVFLLLIFFMVSTTFTLHTELLIQLPEAQGQQSQMEKRTVQIMVDKTGHYFIDEKPLADNKRETLMQALQALKPDPDMPLVIMGDAQAPHQAIVTALDVAGQLQFKKIEITTQNATAPNS